MRSAVSYALRMWESDAKRAERCHGARNGPYNDRSSMPAMVSFCDSFVSPPQPAQQVDYLRTVGHAHEGADWNLMRTKPRQLRGIASNEVLLHMIDLYPLKHPANQRSVRHGKNRATLSLHRKCKISKDLKLHKIPLGRHHICRDVRYLPSAYVLACAQKRRGSHQWTFQRSVLEGNLAYVEQIYQRHDVAIRVYLGFICGYSRQRRKPCFGRALGATLRVGSSNGVAISQDTLRPRWCC